MLFLGRTSPAAVSKVQASIQFLLLTRTPCNHRVSLIRPQFATRLPIVASSICLDRLLVGAVAHIQAVAGRNCFTRRRLNEQAQCRQCATITVHRETNETLYITSSSDRIIDQPTVHHHTVPFSLCSSQTRSFPHKQLTSSHSPHKAPLHLYPPGYCLDNNTGTATINVISRSFHYTQSLSTFEFATKSFQDVLLPRLLPQVRPHGMHPTSVLPQRADDSAEVRKGTRGDHHGYSQGRDQVRRL